ncbi:MAG TPA: fluoride efflux transporter CrcB [Solirubrobacteraceae bacterium]|nr:fluoride efflux transporter CrcB [Solirubrobacteraceae bacterium]
MTVGTWILVGLLGGVGAVCRFVVDGLVSERVNAGSFPWGTFVVNLSGAALLGGLAGAAISGNALLLAGTATLGSYTTLSTWMLETHRLGQGDQLVVAAANLAGSLLIGFGAAAAGHAIGGAL